MAEPVDTESVVVPSAGPLTPPRAGCRHPECLDQSGCIMADLAIDRSNPGPPPEIGIPSNDARQRASDDLGERIERIRRDFGSPRWLRPIERNQRVLDLCDDAERLTGIVLCLTGRWPDCHATDCGQPCSPTFQRIDAKEAVTLLADLVDALVDPGESLGPALRAARAFLAERAAVPLKDGEQ